MRFIANENTPGPAVQALRNRSHDVIWVKERMPGTDDRAVLALAQAEQRVVLTLDTDFGELAFRSRLPAECGIILIRLSWTNPNADNEVLTHALTSRDSWAGTFAVVERDRIRVRPLPDVDATSSSE
jgi:predicted nuclease of predicted toxin-antitoxin system